MFKLQKKDTVKWPVPINIPKDGGGFVTHEATFEFKVFEQSKMDAMVSRLRQEAEEGSYDLLGDLIIGWDQVSDAEGNPLPFNEDHKASMLDIPYVRTALLRTYFDMVSGNKVKRGNS